MATYTAITDTQVDPDAPLTSQLGYQFRDNPIAISEGATGAPKVTGLALGTIFQPYGHTYTTSDVDRWKTIYIQQSSGTACDRVRFSTDGGGSWGASTTFSIGTAWSFAYMDLDSGDIRFNDETLDTITIPVGMNGMQFRNGAGPIAVFVTLIGGKA